LFIGFLTAKVNRWNLGTTQSENVWHENEQKMHGRGLTENDGHENDGYEIGGQDIYRLKIDYIIMRCAILFKTTAEYKSQQRTN